MRVNCHAHVFNAKSVFNKYTIEILINRLTVVDLHEPVKDAVIKQLRSVISDAGEYIDEKSFFQRVLAKVSATDAYKDMLDRAKPALKKEIAIIESERLEKSSVDDLTRLISKISDALDPVDKDVRSQDVMDFMDFLRIGFQPSVRNVTDIILRQMPNKTDAIVALMMDITEDGQDNGQFERQVKDTSDMVLAYPGRVFPSNIRIQYHQVSWYRSGQYVMGADQLHTVCGPACAAGRNQTAGMADQSGPKCLRRYCGV